MPFGPLFRLWRVNYGAGMAKGGRRLEAAQLRREMSDRRFEDALESRLIGNESVFFGRTFGPLRFVGTSMNLIQNPLKLTTCVRTWKAIANSLHDSSELALDHRL